MRLRVLSRRIGSLLVAMVVAVLPASPAFAINTANCSEYGFVNHAVGYVSDRWANNRYGVRATFDNQGLDLCTNPRAGEGSASTAWVAIQGPPSSPNYNIVQMGHGACRPIAGGGCNSTMQDGYAYGRSSAAPGCSGWSNKAPTGVWLGSHSPGGLYSVVEDANHNYSLSSTNHGVWIQTASICWTNDTVATFVETHDYGDSLGGVAANNFNFSNRQFKTSAAGAWLTLPTQCNARTSAADPPFKCAAVSGVLRTWTDR